MVNTTVDMKENILNALNAKIKSKLNDNTIEKLE